MRVTLRDRVRAFLGLVDLPSLAMFKAMEMAQNTRHNAVLDALGRIERRLINEHVGTIPKAYTPPIMDWETAQAVMLHNLEANPEPQAKEQ